jgi:hypothetical protein
MTEVTRTADLHAMLKTRYSQRHGNGPRYVLAPEVRNQAGHAWYNGGPRLRTCDLMVMDTWQSGPVRLIGHEIKVTRSDWQREMEDPDKAAAFIPHVAEWWLVVADRSIVRDGELPEGWGLMAPAGQTLHAVVQPRRAEPQPAVDVGLVAALLRSMERAARVDIERARQPRPHTVKTVPRMNVFDSSPSA